MSRCPIFCQVILVCVCGHMGPSMCQDVSSFGHSLSRCPIFVILLSFRCVLCVCVGIWVLVCQDVSSFGHSLSRCPVFRQVILLSFCCVFGRMGPSVCQDVSSFGHSLSRCPILRQVILLSFCCVTIWCSSVCIRCLILQLQPVLFSPCVCVCVCVVVLVCINCLIKMLCIIFVMFVVRACDWVGWGALFFSHSLSGCFIFHQVTCVCVCVYFVLLCCDPRLSGYLADALPWQESNFSFQVLNELCYY